MPLGSVFIPYVEGISEKLNHYNIGMILKMPCSQRSILLRIRLKMNAHLMAYCLWYFLQIGTSYDDITGRPLAILLKGYKYSQKECLVEKTENCPMYTWRTSSFANWNRCSWCCTRHLQTWQIWQIQLTNLIGNFACKKTLDQQENWQVCIYWNARLGFFLKFDA